MTTLEFNQSTRRASEHRWPINLHTWLDNKALANLVLVAVRELDERKLRPVAPMSAGMAYEPRMLLALVTYCCRGGIGAVNFLIEHRRSRHRGRTLIPPAPLDRAGRIATSGVPPR